MALKPLLQAQIRLKGSAASGESDHPPCRMTLRCYRMQHLGHIVGVNCIIHYYEFTAVTPQNRDGKNNVSNVSRYMIIRHLRSHNYPETYHLRRNEYSGYRKLLGFQKPSYWYYISQRHCRNMGIIHWHSHVGHGQDGIIPPGNAIHFVYRARSAWSCAISREFAKWSFLQSYPSQHFSFDNNFSIRRHHKIIGLALYQFYRHSAQSAGYIYFADTRPHRKTPCHETNRIRADNRSKGHVLPLGFIFSLHLPGFGGRQHQPAHQVLGMNHLPIHPP